MSRRRGKIRAAPVRRRPDAEGRRAPSPTCARSARSTWRAATRIEVVDLIENPALGRGDQILALPTLVRQLPTPIKKIIGDLSNTERVLVGLDLRPRRASA